MNLSYGLLISIALHCLILLIPIPPGEVEVPESHGIQIIDILLADGDARVASGEETTPAPAEAVSSAPARAVAFIHPGPPEQSEPTPVPLETETGDPRPLEWTDRPTERLTVALTDGGLSLPGPSTGTGDGSPGDSVFTAFGTLGGPEFLERTQPVYPKKAKDLEREGVVILALVLDESGRLVSVDVVESGGFGFDEEAVRAVKKSSFLPATRNGRAVACRAILPVRFVLR
jgi:TonB family protein